MIGRTFLCKPCMSYFKNCGTFRAKRRSSFELQLLINYASYFSETPPNLLVCKQCGKRVPKANIELHLVHCKPKTFASNPSQNQKHPKSASCGKKVKLFVSSFTIGQVWGGASDYDMKSEIFLSLWQLELLDQDFYKIRV